ncbi:lysoplasmalogenase [Legionella cardiaca]|uniref:Lysoplasmalogenase n=1 Tax=Legionella cardiaca TaxID=1071983 RepID=A0ABY8ASM0_9GAMM|nr:lysoplasmalogenase [Legionella cardiaca]WED42774.1 lysoplasmalogenase [Legionella cardiaca]
MTGKLPKLSITLFILSAACYLGLLSFIHYPFSSVIKPIPIFLLLIISLQSSARPQIKILLIFALVLSLIGDIILTLPGDKALMGGIISFMLAHGAYITLYLKDAQFQTKRLFYFLPVFLFIILSYSYMLPYFGEMAIPVTIYLGFLTLMVFCSFQVLQHPLFIISGACLFLLSDFIFAMTQFVFQENSNIANILVIFSYYLAQSLLVAGIIQRK